MTVAKINAGFLKTEHFRFWYDNAINHICELWNIKCWLNEEVCLVTNLPPMKQHDCSIYFLLYCKDHQTSPASVRAIEDVCPQAIEAIVLLPKQDEAEHWAVQMIKQQP